MQLGARGGSLRDAPPCDVAARRILDGSAAPEERGLAGFDSEPVGRVPAELELLIDAPNDIARVSQVPEPGRESREPVADQRLLHRLSMRGIDVDDRDAGRASRARIP